MNTKFKYWIGGRNEDFYDKQLLIWLKGLHYLQASNDDRENQSLSLTLPLRWTTELDHRVHETVQKTTTRCYEGASVLYNVHWELSAVTQVI